MSCDIKSVPDLKITSLSLHLTCSAESVYKKYYYYSAIPKLCSALNFYQNELRGQFAVGTITTRAVQLVGTTVFRGRWNFEPSRGICPFLRNFYVFAEFCAIWYWMVIRWQIQHILMEFGPPYCMYTWFHHEIHDCHSGFDGWNTENIELSLSEILPVNLVDRLYLSVAVTGDKYCIFGRVQRPQKINYYVWKICRGEPWNLANWPAEFGKICCGKLWSLTISYINNASDNQTDRLYWIVRQQIIGLTAIGLMDSVADSGRVGVGHSPSPCLPWKILVTSTHLC